MSIYRKVSVKMWGDEKFNRLSAPPPNGQSLWQYLITGDITTSLPGLIHAGKAEIMEKRKWDKPEAFREAFEKAFQEVLDLKMAEYDSECHVIFVPNALKYNSPANPNVVKGWLKPFELVPDCPLKDKYYHHLEAFLKSLSKPFHKAFKDTFAKTVTVTVTVTASRTGTAKKKAELVFPEKFNEFWKSYPNNSEHPGRSNKSKTESQWKARIKDGIEPDQLILAAQNYAQCDYVKNKPGNVMGAQRFIGEQKEWIPYLQKPKSKQNLRGGSDHDQFM